MIAQRTTTIVRNDDLLAHIEDSREFWITRHGRPVKRTWREMTATERTQSLQAEGYARYHQTFYPEYY